MTLLKTPLVGVGLTVLMLAVFAAACALSSLKWRLLGRAAAGGAPSQTDPLRRRPAAHFKL